MMERLAKRFVALWAVGVISAPASVLAQSAEAAQETQIHGGWLVIAAYMVLWVMLLGYVAYLAWQQNRLDDELDELEQRIDRALGATADLEDGN